MKTKYGRLIAVSFVILFALATITPKPAQAGSFTIISPEDVSYGQLGARWWQWIFNIPLSVNPGVDNSGVNCAQGQSGNVWFLVGSFASSTVTRSCNIPSGKSIFFPIANNECSYIENNGSTYQQLLKCSQNGLIGFTNLEADIDGVQVAGLNSNTSQYLAHSGLYYFTLPSSGENLLQYLGDLQALPGTRSQSVTDGWWLMLAPLSAGQHTIHFHGELPTYSFVLDVKYYLNVSQ